MGLDMYLSRRTYVKKWSFQTDKEKINVNVRIENHDVVGIDKDKISYVIEDVMYWRKANHIHYWFVKNVQDNNDNCAVYYLDTEILRKLIKDCKIVLEDNSKAPKILPTTEGFFFGSNNYDEHYFEDIKYTVDELEQIVEDFDKASETGLVQSFYYQSSW
jgi:hypothetical protein